MSAALQSALLAGDRRALAQAITLMESTREDHRRAAEALLDGLMPKTGGSIRIGITGVPGVGKSTLIEALGLKLVEQGKKLAVLAIDPSSKKTGGSILGDKTRMEELTRHPEAFIRPSPAGKTLGGVARRTHEGLLLCEAAGFDVVIVETVGVGQSETAVADMVDLFILLLPPGGGDELQGLKKGIVELADLVVVNKADGDLLPAAQRAVADYQAALHLLTPKGAAWVPRVLQVSALKREGLDALWAAVGDFRVASQGTGQWPSQWQRRRAAQAGAWLDAEVEALALARVLADPSAQERLAVLRGRVEAGDMAPPAAARALIDGD